MNDRHPPPPGRSRSPGAQLLAALHRLAISENGFLFDPATGNSYMVNETGLQILRALQNGDDLGSIADRLAGEYDARRSVLEVDLQDFINSLRDSLGVAADP